LFDVLHGSLDFQETDEFFEIQLIFHMGGHEIDDLSIMESLLGFQWVDIQWGG